MAADGGGVSARRWPDGGAVRIPNWVYTDPDIFAQELERIFAGPSWLYTCLEARVSWQRPMEEQLWDWRRGIGR
jgi:phenylpropionate dioxygenase-like ring-hydroxylating dioxygenase large terminal subunit